jgi:hypothetical protein
MQRFVLLPGPLLIGTPDGVTVFLPVNRCETGFVRDRAVPCS